MPTAPIPTSALPRRPHRNAQKVTVFPSLSTSITLFNVGANRTGATDELLSYSSPTRIFCQYSQSPQARSYKNNALG